MDDCKWIFRFLDGEKGCDGLYSQRSNYFFFKLNNQSFV